MAPPRKEPIGLPPRRKIIYRNADGTAPRIVDCEALADSEIYKGYYPETSTAEPSTSNAKNNKNSYLYKYRPNADSATANDGNTRKSIYDEIEKLKRKRKTTESVAGTVGSNEDIVAAVVAAQGEGEASYRWAKEVEMYVGKGKEKMTESVIANQGSEQSDDIGDEDEDTGHADAESKPKAPMIKATIRFQPKK